MPFPSMAVTAAAMTVPLAGLVGIHLPQLPLFESSEGSFHVPFQRNENLNSYGMELR